jgi:hypothetical protein
MNRLQRSATVAATLLIGILIGGWLFAKSQPRSLIALNRCDQCLTPRDLAGLIASAGVQRLGGHLPFTVLETDRTVALRYPFTGRRRHYVIVPKKDIKNLGDVGPADAPYLLDALYVARRLIESEHLRDYRLLSNGPEKQSVTYLHFHLISD